MNQNKSFRQPFSKGCGFQRQSLWSHVATCETPLSFKRLLKGKAARQIVLRLGELFVREKVPSKLPLSTTPENLPVDGFPAIETIAFTLQKRDSPTDGCCGAAAPFYFIFVNYKEKERERRFAVSFGSRKSGPGKALRCFLQLSEKRIGKGASLFPSLGWEIYSRKTSRGEVFLGCANRKFVRGAFLLQKVPQSAREISLADFPFKRRLTILVFRALRSSTSRRCPLDTCHLLKKVDENFIF